MNDVRKTKQSCLLSLYQIPLFLLFPSVKGKRKGEKELNICPFRKQIYVTFQKKGRGGGFWAFMHFEHNTNSQILNTPIMKA